MTGLRSLMQRIAAWFRNDPPPPPVNPGAMAEAHRALSDARLASDRAKSHRHDVTDQRIHSAELRIYFAAMEARADLGRASHEPNPTADPR